MTTLKDVCAALAELDKHRQTIVCQPGLGDQIQQLVDENMLGGLITVMESPYLSQGTTALIIKHPSRKSAGP